MILPCKTPCLDLTGHHLREEHILNVGSVTVAAPREHDPVRKPVADVEHLGSGKEVDKRDGKVEDLYGANKEDKPPVVPVHSDCRGGRKPGSADVVIKCARVWSQKYLGNIPGLFF